MNFALAKRLSFKAQTRLWGYNLGHSQQEQELSKILIESQMPVKDQSTTANDINPVMAQRNWDRQAEDNVVDRLERLGLLAPEGEVDKVLETVVNNLEVTNNLDIQPEIRCRVLLTSTLESFAIGHTVVFSRGLIDVLPDEASLATMVAHELSHVVLGHRIDGQYAFFDRLLFDEKDSFRHFGFARTQAEDVAAIVKANEVLQSSPYKDQLATAKALHGHALENSPEGHPEPDLRAPRAIAFLPAHEYGLPPRRRLAQPRRPLPLLQPIREPKPAPPLPSLRCPSAAASRWTPGATSWKCSRPSPWVRWPNARRCLEVTPFMLYLTRELNSSMTNPGNGISADSKAAAADNAGKVAQQ